MPTNKQTNKLASLLLLGKLMLVQFELRDPHRVQREDKIPAQHPSTASDSAGWKHTARSLGRDPGFLVTQPV